MKVKYLSLVIASLVSANALSEDIQELATTEVKTTESQQLQVSDVSIELTQATDIKGVLRTLPGVNVSNSIRYSQKTYLRGVEEHSANVTIDGARQDGQMFHHAGNQIVDPFMLKAVSIELGASSVLSGYGANVGAISYVTKDPKDLLAVNEKSGFRVAASADTATEFQQMNLSAYSMLTDSLSGLIALNWNESGDIETPNEDPIVNKHSELKSGLAKLVYDFSDVEQLEFSLQRVDDGGHRALSGEKPGVTTIEEALGFNGYVRDTYTLSYLNSSENPLIDLSIDAYFNSKSMTRGAESGTNWFRDDAGKWHKDGTAHTPERDYIYETYGLNVRNTFVINDIAWTAGIESFRSEQAIEVAGLKDITLSDGTKEMKDISVNNGPTATLVGGYFQGEFTLGDVTVVPGVRYDSYSLGGTYDSSFNQFSPKLQVNWQANEDLALNAGYGRIFKGPGLPETLMITDTMKEADSVEAETGNHLELGLIYDFSTLLNVDSARFSSNVYQYTIDNFYHPTKNTNLARAIVDLTKQGIEAGFTMSHVNFSAFINYSYNDGERDFGAYTSDDYYSGTHVVKVGADYRFNEEVIIGWDSYFASSAELAIRSVGDNGIETDTINKTGYGVTNFWLDYQVKQVEGLAVQFAIENAFDKAYQNHDSFGMFWGDPDYNDNEVGRNIKATVSYQF